MICVSGVPADQMSGHRMYDLEVIELSPEVSFLLILPPTEDVCSVPGQVDDFSEKTEFTALTVPVFEMSKFFFQNKVLHFRVEMCI